MNSAFQTVTSLSDIYAEGGAVLAAQDARFKKLKADFKKVYGTEPDFIARSPGRVNLIGEHIDYSDYSVLPMALTDKDIIIAVKIRPQDKHVRLANVNAASFPQRVIDMGDIGQGFVQIDATQHEWSNYFKSGMKGVLLALHDRQQLKDAVGMNCLVDGSVPTGAGVSSSSAFVCCAALATMRANNGHLTMKELTEVAIVSERFVGVESGGMDQSASIFGLTSAALLIDFVPSLNVTPVPIPSTSPAPVFVIAHTLVTADKHVTAPVCYNLRVVETRVAAAVLGKAVLKNPETWRQLVRLRGLMEACTEDGLIRGTQPDKGIMSSLEDMLALVDKHLKHHEGYTREEIAQCLGLSVEEVQQKYMSKFPIRAETFQLYRRAKHVFSEALRVYQFKMLCSAPVNSDTLTALGRLMNESQESCRDLFDCSCPELDELTALARQSGALGSRLTGAGWGGCTVSLVPEPLVASFMDKIKVEYYQKRANAPSDLENFMFSSKPGRGATLYTGP